MPDVLLKVNGSQYAGWTDVSVTRDIEAIANSFQLSVSDRWNGQTKPWPILEEDVCELLVGGRTLITGYVDSRGHKYDKASHSLSVTGRDKAGALVDNSAVLEQLEFSHIPILDFCQKLAAPFGVIFS